MTRGAALIQIGDDTILTRLLSHEESLRVIELERDAEDYAGINDLPLDEQMQGMISGLDAVLRSAFPSVPPKTWKALVKRARGEKGANEDDRPATRELGRIIVEEIPKSSSPS